MFKQFHTWKKISDFIRKFCLYIKEENVYIQKRYSLGRNSKEKGFVIWKYFATEISFLCIKRRILWYIDTEVLSWNMEQNTILFSLKIIWKLTWLIYDKNSMFPNFTHFDWSIGCIHALAPNGSSFKEVIGPLGWFKSPPLPGGRPNIRAPLLGPDDG